MPTTGASPHFLAIFLLSLFIFHRPCIYCSLILIALFSTTCFFNDHCFIDSNMGNIFLPRLFLPLDLASKPSVVFDMLAERAVFSGISWFRRSASFAAATGNSKSLVSSSVAAAATAAREFRVPCVAVNIRL
ncbi:hypothetical protein POJ06DRAFT_269482 [Lipomyces tetrasporus]|uniref:Bladder cancer-related BC10-like protein n=1 Tax=Lipomyces tetrasporus TaxID=54092 RepID=A0AAD7QTH0_9ASCO|nr:uncharacterized protein POJ06DRAFT_269482 [Lipomyces tetrasporus]KAJ8099422.1 hypothetical protein POJ06DRAFT_269482 [Lipomyces tetrasporus]